MGSSSQQTVRLALLEHPVSKRQKPHISNFTQRSPFAKQTQIIVDTESRTSAKRTISIISSMDCCGCQNSHGSKLKGRNTCSTCTKFPIRKVYQSQKGLYCSNLRRSKRPALSDISTGTTFLKLFFLTAIMNTVQVKIGNKKRTPSAFGGEPPAEVDE